jgi:hypothetical protein
MSKQKPCNCYDCKRYNSITQIIPYEGELPCEGCISVAICRHKIYRLLFQQCIDLKLYIPQHTHPYERSSAKIQRLEEVLNPTEWTFLVHHQETHDCPLIFRKVYIDGTYTAKL